MRRTPKRGEIWFARLDPVEGHEQRGTRPVFVLSPEPFNRLGLAVICPISQGAVGSRFAGFAATLSGAGTETQGVVMCNQPRTLDFQARGVRYVEAAPEEVTAEVLARVSALLE